MMMLVPAHSGSVVPGLPAHEGGAPASPRVVCRSGGKVDVLPIVESSWRSDTHPMSNDATPTLGGFGGDSAEASSNNDVHRSVDNDGGAGWSPLSPIAVAQRSSRRQRAVVSFLAGARLVAGGAALILLGWGIAEALRSPLPVPLTSGGWSIGQIFLVVLLLSWTASQMQPSSRWPAGLIVGYAVGGLGAVSFLLLLLGGRIVDMIGRSGAIVPEYIGRLVVGWVCLVLAILSHLVLRVCQPPAPPQAEGSEGSPWTVASTSETAVGGHPGCGKVVSSSPAVLLLPQYARQADSAARKPVGECMRDVGLGLICIAVVAAMVMTVPNFISRFCDRFVRVTISAGASHDGFPTVEEMAAATVGKGKTGTDPMWTATFDDSSVHEILAGVRGAVVVTRNGIYGLDSSTGKVTWSFATTEPNGRSYRENAEPLKGASIYGGRSAFTSPNGAWLAYALNVSPESSFSDTDSGVDVTRVVVLSTDTGRVALDTQVTGAAPAVQLTDSKTVINRKVYDTADGRELRPLDEEKTAISGPGGHSAVVVRDKQEDSQYQRPVIDLEALPNAGSSSGSFLSSRRIEAQLIAGQPVNVGGWVVNAAEDGTVENIDSGETVSLKGEDKPDNWALVAIQASAQAVSAWTIQDEVEGQAKEFGHPLVLNVFDTRSGKVTAVDPAGTYRIIKQNNELTPDRPYSYPPYSGAVDNPVFSARVDDENHHSFSDQLVVPQNDAARQDAEQDRGATDSGGHEPAWVSVSLPRFWVTAGPVALCPGGVIVSDDSRSSASAVVAGRKAPQR